MRTILTYHSIDPSGSPVSVDEAVFARHVEFLASGTGRVVPLADLIEMSDATDTVAITFDDGFESFANLAWPRLKEAGLPVTVFLVGSRVGMDNSWGGRRVPGIPTLPLMDWETIGRLAGEGVEFGAHSWTHPDLEALDDEALRDEVLGGTDLTHEVTGQKPRCFAYPYGRHGPRSKSRVRDNFDVAVTTEHRWLRTAEDPHLLPRLDAWYFRKPGRLEGYGRRIFRSRVRCRAVLRGVRRVFGRSPTPVMADRRGRACKMASPSAGGPI